MKHTKIIIAAIGLLFAACNQPDSSKTSQTDTTATITTTKSNRTISCRSLPTRDSFSQFIPIDSANKMLESYLSSINYQQNDTDLHALIFNANMLRRMLSDPRIANVKVMFAHSLDYINAGGRGINCGYQSKELTVIISGYDDSGNYSYNPQNTVLEMATPCPPNCPTVGTASSALLTPVLEKGRGK